MIVETKFDGLLEDDIVFEETESTAEVQDILKNAENMYKGMLYLKAMFGGGANMSDLVKVNTVEYSSRAGYSISATTTAIMVKNISDSNLDLFINSGRLVMLPYESFEFPVKSDTTLELQGKASIVETIYRAV